MRLQDELRRREEELRRKEELFRQQKHELQRHRQEDMYLQVSAHCCGTYALVNVKPKIGVGLGQMQGILTSLENFWSKSPPCGTKSRSNQRLSQISEVEETISNELPHFCPGFALR